MSVESEPYYWVECGTDGCAAKVPAGDDCITYDAALTVAIEMGWVLTRAGELYCEDCVDDDAVDTGPTVAFSTARGETLTGLRDMSAPVRIQRRRTKGWLMLDAAVYVGRPTKWGNPFAVGLWYGASGPNGEWSRSVHIADRATAVAEYRRAARLGHPGIPSDPSPLRGHDLACWCPLDQPCHADVLLELANPS